MSVIRQRGPGEFPVGTRDAAITPHDVARLHALDGDGSAFCDGLAVVAVVPDSLWGVVPQQDRCRGCCGALSGLVADGS